MIHIPWLSEQSYSHHPPSVQVKILDAMQDIYYGRVASPWALDVDDWTIDPHQVRIWFEMQVEMLSWSPLHLVASYVWDATRRVSTSTCPASWAEPTLDDCEGKETAGSAVSWNLISA